MWGSQAPPWGPCWSLHTGAAPVSPVQLSSSGRWVIQSHPFPIWHQLHCICIPLTVLVPGSPRFLAGVHEVFLLCHGQPGTMQGHQGAAVGAAVGAASVAIAGTNTLLCPSLSNATSSCSHSSISSTHKDFILLQVSFHSQLPYPGTSTHPMEPLALGRVLGLEEPFGAGIPGQLLAQCSVRGGEH